MRSRAAALIPIVLALGCAGGAPEIAEKASADDVATVRQAIDQVNAEFVAALKVADIPKLVSYYDAEGMAMPPNVPAARSATEIQKGLSDFLGAMTVVDFKLTTLDVVVKEDMAIETGTSVMTMQPKQPGAPAITDNGKYVVVWKKQADGSWKLWRDIFNSSDPLPAPK